MTWTPYTGDDYLDFPAVEALCRAAAAAHPDWVRIEEIGRSRHDRPLLLLTVGQQDGRTADRPAFWLDGGTHAAEWTGVMSALHTLSGWLTGLRAGDAALTAWFTTHTAYVIPCISPDGFQAMHTGAPFIRSTLRPPKPGTVRSGLSPQDIDGDGVVRWMRWRHPAGSWVPDGDSPVLMRPRTVDDAPADAFFVCEEGLFITWDGVRWVEAPREFGLDLNRNFPVDWAPFSMFGMDSGAFPASEPESDALLRALAARPNVTCAVTNHTYTGCILTPPARKDSALPSSDAALMHRLALDAAAGTGYRVFKVYPEFMYDPSKPIIGTWDDTLSAVFGIAGYTLELWDPMGWVGIENDKPVEMFRDPDMAKIRTLVERIVETGAHTPWRPFAHPQLGAVEIGGIDYMRTVRNPPTALLAAECRKGSVIADRIRRAAPTVSGQLTVHPAGPALHEVVLVLENTGALSSAGLAHAEAIGASPPVSATLQLPEGAALLSGTSEQALHHMDGWMSGLHGFARNAIYPALPARGHRTTAKWLVRGSGTITVRWHAGRGGTGQQSATL